MNNIAIFASGSGTNAENIIRYFQKNADLGVKTALLLSNSPHAYALERAQRLEVPTIVFNRDTFYQTSDILDVLQAQKVDFIVLAGFLWLLPPSLIAAYPRGIVNIHPALLPKFGGKGMYGMHVHKAVKEAGETETGITIHYVNEEYDSGSIIFQAKCAVEKSDTAEDIAAKIHELEQEHFPKVLEKVLLSGK